MSLSPAIQQSAACAVGGRVEVVSEKPVDRPEQGEVMSATAHPMCRLVTVDGVGGETAKNLGGGALLPKHIEPCECVSQ